MQCVLIHENIAEQYNGDTVTISLTVFGGHQRKKVQCQGAAFARPKNDRRVYQLIYSQQLESGTTETYLIYSVTSRPSVPPDLYRMAFS
jgi:hypothetical protein